MSSMCAADCLALLAALQNSDGGWGFRKGGESRVEPTCWAYWALSSTQSMAMDSPALHNARQFLFRNQAKDGFWTATPEMKTGNWVTSLACAVLAQGGDAQAAISAGLAWLCNDYPLDSSLLVRLIDKLRGGSKVDEMSNAYRGWGWTPRTSSWVEPTAFAILALQECPPSVLPDSAARRQESAIALLYDRMCPGGGWNCGNPSVYGVAGQPLVLPTAWALLALHASPEHPRRKLSLDWLRADVPNIESASSLAAATICLELYGEAVPVAKLSLHECSPEEIAADGTHALAWAALALAPERAWPLRAEVPA